MAHWRDTLVPGGKFRDAPFLIRSSDRSGGRRNVRHKYPFRDDPPYGEDMGDDGRDFSIECIVIGAEYVAARDALLTALEKGGPGELVHPYHGTRRVMADKWRVRESQAEGGWAQITIDFFETSSAPAQPGTAVAGAALVTASAAAAQSSVSAAFAAAFDGAATLRDSVTGALRSASRAVSSVVSRVDMVAQTAATLQRSLKSLSTDAASVAASGSAVQDAVVGIVQTLAGSLAANAVLGAADPTGVLLALYSTSLGTRPPAGTPPRAAEQANFDALQKLLQRTVVVQAATVAIVQVFTSYDDAIRTRDAINALIDEQAELAPDDTFAAMTQLRADIVRAVPGETSDLPRLLTYVSPNTLPSLVLAHNLYGNLDREADVIARNKIAHPGFILGQTPLEVLSRE